MFREHGNTSCTLSERAYFDEARIPWGYRERATQFQSDPRPEKLDLGAGVVKDCQGRVISFPVVERVMQELLECPVEKGGFRGYPPPLGEPEFRESVRRLYLGEAAASLSERSFAIQTIGGAQALRLSCDCIKRLGLSDTIAISEQSWGDHRRIAERTGLAVVSYPYLHNSAVGVDFEALCAGLRSLAPQTAVVLQVSCHNPTGYDLSDAQWRQVFSICRERTLLPILDAAYIGFGNGVTADLYPIQLCVEAGIDFFIACSCCKPFSMYNARVGALIAVTHNSESSRRLESQLKSEVQANHSSPPSFHARVISTILGNEKLTEEWKAQLEDARNLVDDRRGRLVHALQERSATPQLLRVATQTGIFCWTGLQREVCRHLTDRYGIYLPSNGRICLGALPDSRIESLADLLLKASSVRQTPVLLGIEEPNISVQRGESPNFTDTASAT